MTRAELHKFARTGAEARLQAISDERAAIIRMFPDLRTLRAATAGSLDGAAAPVARQPRKRRGMSPAERKAVGARMKAYWAKRRALKAGAKKAASKAKRKGSMSAEARKAQGERMRAYWAKRRKEKAGSAEGGQAEAAVVSGKASRKRRNK
jgi:hypothetical protein